MGAELPGGVNHYTVEDADKQFSLAQVKETNRDYLMQQREKIKDFFYIRKATNNKKNVLYNVFFCLLR